MEDYYSILGVQYTDDAETIKRAYRRLALTCHPDKGYPAEVHSISFCFINRNFKSFKKRILFSLMMKSVQTMINSFWVFILFCFE